MRALAVLCCALHSGQARAEDWLASLPPCSTEARDTEFAVVYPRAGLPALVAAGERLIARVRVPSPLTPPPGIQQPRALAGFRAELVARAAPLPDPESAGARPPVARHRLEVVDVRPDAASSLLYRAAIPLPAWIAPGTYDLVLAAPGGQGRAPAAVRVLAPGTAPRVAWLGDAGSLAHPALATLPIDVFVLAPGAKAPALGADPGAASVAWLDPRGHALALRVGERLWVSGACPSGHAMFDHEIATALARDRALRRVDPPAPALSEGQLQPWGETARALPEDDAVRARTTPQGLELSVASAFAEFPHAELAFVVAPARAPLAFRSAEAEFYPGGDVGAGAVPPLVLRLRVAKGSRALVTAALSGAASGAAPIYTLSPAPPRVQSGRPVRVRVRAPSGAPAPVRVAYRFDALHTAFGAADAEHVFGALGTHRVHALVLGPGGEAHPLSTVLEVETARPGCAAGAAPGPGTFASCGSLGLWAALSLVQRRRGRKRAARNARE